MFQDDDDPLRAFATPEYLTKMARSGTWVDAVAVQAMARMVGHDIHIVTSQQISSDQGYLVNEILAGPVASESPLLLGHLDEKFRTTTLV